MIISILLILVGLYMKEPVIFVSLFITWIPDVVCTAMLLDYRESVKKMELKYGKRKA